MLSYAKSTPFCMTAIHDLYRFNTYDTDRGTLSIIPASRGLNYDHLHFISFLICFFIYPKKQPCTREEKMLIEFSIVPLGIASSIGDKPADVLRIVDASGLLYKINPMGTVIEGKWDEAMKIVRKCHMTVMKKGERVLTDIKIDDRKGMPNRIDAKVKSIERRIEKPLKK